MDDSWSTVSLCKLKGVNLHEHHEVTGHVVDEATMLRDIELMKASNMNAVRNSHYPHQDRWYELVSEHGLYMVDEANIESHGYGYDHDKTLGNKPHWKDHHLDRTRRMLERAKNYPLRRHLVARQRSRRRRQPRRDLRLDQVARSVAPGPV